MAMYLGRKKGMLCKGEGYPAAIYKGKKFMAGAVKRHAEGVSLNFDDIYNGARFGLNGNTTQTSDYNVRSVSGSVPIKCVKAGTEVTVEGKNLFDKDTMFDNWYPANTEPQVMTLGGAAFGIHVPCKPNTTYIITKTNGSRFNVGYITAPSPCVANVPVYGWRRCEFQSTNGNDGTTVSATITTGDNATYVVSYLYYNGTATPHDTISKEEMGNTIKVFEGTPVTPVTLTTPCDLYSGDKCTWYPDRTEVVHNMDKIDLGTLTFNARGNNVFTSKNTDFKSIGIGFCEAYKFDTGTTKVPPDMQFNFNRNYDDNTVQIHDSNYTNAWTFKSAISGIYLVYQKKKPTTETFPAQVQPNTFKRTLIVTQQPTELEGTLTVDYHISQ